MNNQFLFNFKTDISSVDISSKLNNPFGTSIPDIAKIAANEFQEFIALESEKWSYDFRIQRGKMFGILVVQKTDNTYCYLGTVSGKLPENAKSQHDTSGLVVRARRLLTICEQQMIGNISEWRSVMNEIEKKDISTPLLLYFFLINCKVSYTGVTCFISVFFKLPISIVS